MNIGRLFPRLIFVDLIEREKIHPDESVRQQYTQIRGNSNLGNDDHNTAEAHMTRTFTRKSTITTAAIDHQDSLNLVEILKSNELESRYTKGRHNKYVPCLRVLCEYEEGWHQMETYTALGELKNSFCPYLSRMMNLLKKYDINE